MSWEHCVPLQPADMMAYEHFKEAERKVSPRKRRKSLELLLDLESLGGRGSFIDRDALLKLKEVMDEAKRKVH